MRNTEYYALFKSQEEKSCIIFGIIIIIRYNIKIGNIIKIRYYYKNSVLL